MTSSYARAVADWYSAHARDLPWRRPGASAWSILVSEIMLQQTPVSRVLPAHAAWLDRWPEPAALAAATPADAVRQWDRLGYPRRAVRLHAA
ncbi:MAG: A/G-specific adenine glycosylase, partial [Actinobacteria bacterium]|nr:A/G-specific adenine glycosylase [Actinomycetota bacterium]